jgi:hypothetical protein
VGSLPQGGRELPRLPGAAVAVALGDSNNQDTAFQPMVARIRQLEEAGRSRRVRQATELLTPPARRIDAAWIDQDRADALGVIAIVAALVQLAARREVRQSLSQARTGADPPNGLVPTIRS